MKDTGAHALDLSKALFVCGPTASGKSDLAHGVARRLRALGREVSLVNMDAFQFYRGFDIGTAKPSEAERREFPYAFVDILEPEDVSDAQEFAAKAREHIRSEQAHGRFVIVVGGSGLYLRGLLHGFDALPGRHDEFRTFVREIAQHQGRKIVHDWLRALDPRRAEQLHPQDLVRVERALEIYFSTGAKPSEAAERALAPRQGDRLVAATVVNLALSRSVLDARIQQRTRALLWGSQGPHGHQDAESPKGLEGPWILEVRRLLRRYGSGFDRLSASRAIGYREIAATLWDPASASLLPPLSPDVLEELTDRITTLTRQYSKRQETWMKSASVDVTLSDGEAVSQFLSSVVSGT